MLDDDLAALALTSRLIDAGVKPLSPREFWRLSGRIDVSSLRGMTAAAIASDLTMGADEAGRIAALVDRVTGVALAVEQLDHSGIWTITCLGERYPQRWRDRLGDAAPVVLHGVGDATMLQRGGVGVVGSRDASDDGLRVARDIGSAAAQLDLPLISGMAQGVDRAAMNGAFEAGGRVVGVLADSLQGAVARPATRRGIASGQICLITQYAPAAPFSARNALSRNKLVYALSRCTVVVVSEHGSGGTWAGATEALTNRYGRVAAWTGPGAGPGNVELAQLGAVEIRDVERLGECFRAADTPAEVEPTDDQMTLGF